MNTQHSVQCDLILVGGGHSHLFVLMNLARRPVPGLRVTLITREANAPYSGMLPGLIAGHYQFDDTHIDLEPLVHMAGARFVIDTVTGLDLANRAVVCQNRPPIPFDLLSLDIGSTPTATIQGAAELTLPIKPVSEFLIGWREIQRLVLARQGASHVAVIGAGAGGVEVALAVSYRLRSLLQGDGRLTRDLVVHLVGDALLPGHIASVSRQMQRHLDRLQIHCHFQRRVKMIRLGQLILDDGSVLPVEHTILTTGAQPAPWIAESGLTIDDRGFARVDAHLRCVDHPHIFASGDIAALPSARPKAGVFAVRQGPILGENLRRAALQFISGKRQRLQRYRPQRRFLCLLSTGDAQAVMSWGSLSLSGAWIWRWKDRIDRKFMRKFKDLPPMPIQEMRCKGCGSKQPAAVLRQALADFPADLSADDAARISVAGRELIVSADGFTDPLNDPFEFGALATRHALNDIYAMGGAPHAATALVQWPAGEPSHVAADISQLLSGVHSALQEVGAQLVGGHTALGHEPWLGLSVIGTPPLSLWRKDGLRSDDALILTKPLGTGVLLAARMQRKLRGEWRGPLMAHLRHSNAEAVFIGGELGVNACTDISGFGLFGHLQEMTRSAKMSCSLHLNAIPMLPGAEALTVAGVRSSLYGDNRQAASVGELANPRFPLLFDPQTQGGLLFAMPVKQALHCVALLNAVGYTAAIIGQVGEPDPLGRIELNG